MTEFEEWKSHPVTKAFMREVHNLMVEQIEQLCMPMEYVDPYEIGKYHGRIAALKAVEESYMEEPSA